MSANQNELPQIEPFSITQLLIEGQYTPDAQELLEALSEIDLVEQLKDTKLVDKDQLTLSFDSRDHARLFALYLGAQGHSREIFHLALSDSFFQADLLDDYRPDGVVLSLSESIRNDRNEISTVLRQGDDNYRDKLTNLVKDVIAFSTPHLANEVNNITL